MHVNNVASDVTHVVDVVYSTYRISVYVTVVGAVTVVYVVYVPKLSVLVT